MGQTLERMKEGYSQIRNEALAYAFSYMNLIEHWGSGIPRIIGKVKAAGLREPEFIGGEVDLRINIYRGRIDGTVAPNSAAKPPLNRRETAAKLPATEQEQQIYKYVLENTGVTTAQAMKLLGIKQRRTREILGKMVESGWLRNRQKYDTKPVTVSLLSASRKISNMIFNLNFYQKDAVGANREAAAYQVYFVDAGGKQISDVQKIIADKTNENGTERTFRCTFNLKPLKYSNTAAYYLVIADEQGLQLPQRE